jgi:hypothetical protein
MLSHKELAKRLKRLQKAINKNVKHPNYGGCGVIAAIVGQQIADLGFEVEVVTPVYYPNAAPAAVREWVNNKNRAMEWQNAGLSRTHLAIRFKSNGRCYTWCTDGGLLRSACQFGAVSKWAGKGKRAYSTTKRFGDGLTVAECWGMCRTADGWNKMFDRKASVPTIRTLTDYHLRLGL